MANLNVKPAASRQWNHSYNPITVGTTDLGKFFASRVVECNDGDHFKNFKGKGFMRVAPSIFPAFGRLTLNTAAFFVPENQLTEQSNAIHTNMNSYLGKPVVVPWFYHFQINELFANYDETSATPLCKVVGTSNDPTNDTNNIPKTDGVIDPWKWDFIYPQHNAATQNLTEYWYYKLTPLGRVFYGVLASLGYDFGSFPNLPVSAMSVVDLTNYCNEKLNAFPFLSYAKIFTDYFINPHLYNQSLLVKFLRNVHDVEDSIQGAVQYYAANSGLITTAGLYFVLRSILVPHKKNMYLNAYNSPMSPTGVNEGSAMISQNPNGPVSPVLPDSSSSNYQTLDANDQDVNIRQYLNTTLQSLSWLNQFGLNLLLGFYRFVKRNNIVGSRAAERVLARIGIKPEELSTNVCVKLCEGTTEVDFSAVVSNSDTSGMTDGKTLGSYAGFSVAALNFSFNYKCRGFGYIVVLHWLQAIPMIERGLDPAVLRINPQDWFTPEFDGQTIRAIPMSEISVSKETDLLTTNGDKKIYGFTDLYDDYRTLRDKILGDFRLFKNIHNFVFSRDFSYFRDHGSTKMAPQNNSIQYYDHDNNKDLSNPFQIASTVGDRFYLQINFDIKALRSVMSKSAALDLNGEGDLQIQEGGKQM